MASHGIEAWTRHFMGKSVSTILRKDSRYYHANGCPSEYMLSLGHPLVVEESFSYDTKPLISTNLEGTDIHGRVKFADLTKPMSMNLMKLKPQDLNINGEYTLPEYIGEVKETLRKKRMPILDKEYLSQLVDFFSSTGTERTKIKRSISQYDVRGIKAELESDFSEVLHPIYVLARNAEGAKKGKVGINGEYSKIVFTSNKAEILYDFKIKNSGIEYLFSSKRKSGTSNTLKIEQVYNLLHQNKITVSKYKTTYQYKMMEASNNAEGTHRKGIAACVSLANSGIPGFVGVYPKSYDFRKINKGPLDQETIDAFKSPLLMDAETASMSPPTGTALGYICERHLEQWTRSNRNIFSSIFEDSILNEIIFIKSKFSTTSLPEFEIFKPEHVSSNVYLRSKNGYTRSKDSIGFQV